MKSPEGFNQDVTKLNQDKQIDQGKKALKYLFKASMETDTEGSYTDTDTNGNIEMTDNTGFGKGDEDGNGNGNE